MTGIKLENLPDCNISLFTFIFIEEYELFYIHKGRNMPREIKCN